MNDQTPASESKGGRDYSETLFLPKTDFPMRAGLPQREPEILKRWESMQLYKRLREKAKGREGILIGGVDAMPPAIAAVQDGRMFATVRNPSCRIHGGSIIAGVEAVGDGLGGGEVTGEHQVQRFLGGFQAAGGVETRSELKTDLVAAHSAGTISWIWFDTSG